jgi:hypothetical protein
MHSNLFLSRILEGLSKSSSIAGNINEAPCVAQNGASDGSV